MKWPNEAAKLKPSDLQICYLDHALPRFLAATEQDGGASARISWGYRSTSSSVEAMKEAQRKSSVHAQSLPTTPRSDAEKRLVDLFDQIYLEFQESIGEIDRFKQLIVEMPFLRPLVEKEMPDVNEHCSRLLGHLRAVEKAHTHLLQYREETTDEGNAPR